MIAALSFDDGPDGRWTPQILDLLYDAGTHATFFVLGAHIAGNEALLQRMIDEGHEVGNHGWSHRHLPRLSDDEVRSELDRTDRAIGDVIDEEPLIWRAPYLDVDERLELIAADLFMRHIGCDVIPGDWNLSDPQQIAQNVLSELKDGDIVLLHDGIPPDGGSGTDSRQPTCDALALLLETPGISWCSVSELP